MSVLREWKKIYEADLESVIYELKDFLTTPSCVILSGEVGVGKTTFTQVFVKSVIGSQEVFSPTYSVVNEIDNFVHADFYRIEDPAEILHLELPVYFEDKDYIFIEWGRNFIKEIYQQTYEDTSFYELSFEVNELKENQKVPSRNLRLIKIPT